MPIIKCKMCGGDLNLTEGSTVCECEYCGTKQTVPSADNEKKLTLFNRAGRLLRTCEFDKAAGVFETIVADFPQEAEAYWGLVLCKYGIEYVDDPATGKKIPTCHRSSFDSVLDDANFEQACENTDAVARRVYRDEARQIEALRQAILQVSGKEEPYDVFISYKETDEHGERTLDSVIAQDIYKELTNEGYRVFFSRISLEDKLGTEYEPYIFAALNSAKVMLVVGTDYENFDAVWVKNEWSRFLKLIAKGEKKTLIPVFKNMDAYDMPKEFAKLAAQDMGKVGAMQDLVRGVEKLVGKKKAEPVQAQPVQQVVQQTVVQGGGPNVLALLKRGQQALEDGDWAKAKGFYDQVLSMDAENADAFLGLALAGQQVRDLRSYIDALFPRRVNIETDTLECDQAHIGRSITKSVVPGYCEGSELKKLYDFAVAYPVKLREETAATQQIKSRFNGDRNLSRAFRYAQGETKQKLETLKNELFDTLDKRVRAAEASDKKALEEAKAELTAKLETADRKAEELTRAAQEKREADYQTACKQADDAKEDFEFINAGIALKRVGPYKDAAERARDCEQKATEIKTRREQAEREAKEKTEAAQRKKKRNTLFILGALAVAAFVIMLIVIKVIVPASKYNAAVKLSEQGRYEEAIAAFTELGEYKDSKNQIATNTAAMLDSARQAAYEEACKLLEEGYYLDAESAFKKLDSYLDSSEKAAQAREQYMAAAYQDAVSLFNSKDYTSAIEAFKALGDYEDSKSFADEAESMKKAVEYSDAEALASQGKKFEAAVAFYALKGYRDSWDRCFVLWGDITQRYTIAAGDAHTLGVKNNGTVIAAGSNDCNQCNVSSWSNIVAVAAGWKYSVGLKSDGTVVAVGENEDGQCNTSGWKDIVAICTWSDQYNSVTVGLKADGTVVRSDGKKLWEDSQIVSIDAGQNFVIGLTAGGGVVVTRLSGDSNLETATTWKDIIAVSSGGVHALGLKADGTVLSTKYYSWKYNSSPGEDYVDSWSSIKAVSAGYVHSVGLKKDGTVISTSISSLYGSSDYGQTDVSGWKNVVEIATYDDHTVGLINDGTVVAVGRNDCGQCDVTGWTDIKLPKK